MPSLMAESNCQCPVPFTRGKEEHLVLAASPEEGQGRSSVYNCSAGRGQPSVVCAEEEERHDKDCSGQGPFAGRGQKESTFHLKNAEEKNVLPSSIQKKDKSPEAETVGDSSTTSYLALRSLERNANSSVHLSGPEQTSDEELSISICHLATVNTGAKKSDHIPPIKDPAAEYSIPPLQQGPEDNLKATTTKCITGQESKIASSHTLILPAAYHLAPSAPQCVKDLPPKSDHNGKCTAKASAEKTEHVTDTRTLLHKEGNLKVTVSAKENLCDRGENLF
jgi:hypothetical protein